MYQYSNPPEAELPQVRMLGAAATHLQPPKPAPLRDAGFAALCGGAGMWLLLARVWLCEDL